eukprot:jgi/Tetstr1/436000/TSEL_024881.t1
MADESAPSDEAASALSSGHQAQDPEEISCEQGLLVSPAGISTLAWGFLRGTAEPTSVISGVKHEFRVPAGSSQEMEFAFDLASTQLENLQARTAHYDALMESHSFSPEALKAIKGVDTLAQKRKQ